MTLGATSYPVKVHRMKGDSPACGTNPAPWRRVKPIGDTYTGSPHTICGNCFKGLKVTVTG